MALSSLCYAATIQFVTLGIITGFMGYDVPPLSEADRNRDWVMILSPNNEFEAGVISGRLRLAGIRVKFDDAVMGGWIGKMRMRVIQVRTEDYDKARELVNEA